MVLYTSGGPLEPKMQQLGPGVYTTSAAMPPGSMPQGVHSLPASARGLLAAARQMETPTAPATRYATPAPRVATANPVPTPERPVPVNVGLRSTLVDRAAPKQVVLSKMVPPIAGMSALSAGFGTLGASPPGQPPVLSHRSVSPTSRVMQAMSSSSGPVLSRDVSASLIESGKPVTPHQGIHAAHHTAVPQPLRSESVFITSEVPGPAGLGSISWRTAVKRAPSSVSISACQSAVATPRTTRPRSTRPRTLPVVLRSKHNASMPDLTGRLTTPSSPLQTSRSTPFLHRASSVVPLHQAECTLKDVRDLSLPTTDSGSSSKEGSETTTTLNSIGGLFSEDQNGPTQEDYHQLLKVVAAQEKNKAELSDKLAQSEQDRRLHQSENKELRSMLQLLERGNEVHCALHFLQSGKGTDAGDASAVSSGPATARSTTGGPAQHGRTRTDTPSPVRRSKAVTWKLPWSPPRTPKSWQMLIPYALPKESIGDKYAVQWGECIHVGTNSGLGVSLTHASISCFYKAKAKGNGALRAVRVIYKQQILYPKLFQQQLSDLHQLDHPSMTKLHDVYEDQIHVLLVFDFLAGPSLLEKAVGDAQFCERDAAAAFKVVLQVLAYLHERKIVHQNLHPENLRYGVSPKKKGSGSAYHDQLKLLDFGLCLEIKHLSYDLQAVEASDARHLPLLQLVGAQASMGGRCVPPEFRSTPFNKELGWHMATWFSASCGQDGSVSNSSVSGRFQEDPVSRQVKDAYKLLEASDMWSAGCMLHLLLTGLLPGEPASSSGAGGGVSAAVRPERAALDFVSADARELCASLLQQDPRARPSAAEALQSCWLVRCEALSRAHRSVVARSAGTASMPIASELRARLVRQYTACRLRKLVLALYAMKWSSRSCGVTGADGVEGKGPPALLRAAAVSGGGQELQEAGVDAAGIKQVVISMCNEAFQAICRKLGSTLVGPSCGELSEAIQKAGALPWKDPQATFKKICGASMSKASTISSNVFAEFLWAACFASGA